MTQCSHFSAAFNNIFVPSSDTQSRSSVPLPLLLFLLLSTPLLLSVIALRPSADSHGHVWAGRVIVSGHGIVVSFITDGGGGGAGVLSLLSGCRHGVEGNEADEDDHQGHQVETRELR